MILKQLLKKINQNSSFGKSWFSSYDQAEEEVSTGNPAVPIATPVTQAAATAVVGEAATDETQARPITAELDKSAAIPTDETAVGEIAPPTTNPDTGEVKPGSISLDFPVFVHGLRPCVYLLTKYKKQLQMLVNG
jgi:hypothetical protein